MKSKNQRCLVPFFEIRIEGDVETTKQSNDNIFYTRDIDL